MLSAVFAITVRSFLVDEDDLRDVRSAVADLAGRWKDFGISLGIRLSKLDELNSHSPSESVREMLALWLRQNYNVKTIITISYFIFSYTKHTSLVSSLLKYPMPTLKNLSSLHHCAQLTETLAG